MKKLYLFLPLLCLVPAACSTSVANEPETETHAINFRAPQAETRAVVDSESLPDNFLVWGGYDGDATRVFDGTTVYKNAGWNYTDGTRYWTEGKSYDFYAVYPADLPAGSTASVDEKGTITVENFDCSATGADAVDLMTATASRDYNGTNNSAVGLTFQHELARVTCKVKSENSAVTITSVKLYGVGYKGNLTKTAGTATTSTWSDIVTYTADNTPLKMEEEFSLNTTSGLEKDNVLGDLLLLPQTLEATAQFSLTYRYNSDTNDRTATVSLPTGSEWTAGQHYNYTLTLKAATVTLNVTVLDWEDVNTSVSWGDGDSTTTTNP